MLRLAETPIKAVKVIDRYREDKGDIEELAASIKEKGILQPIVVNQDMKLLAGERRLLAAGMAGLKNVPTVMYHTQGELDPLEVEYIENVFRKDFTWQERAKLERRIFNLKKAKDPKWTERTQAALMDQSKSTVNRRLQLAEAMELLPDLGKNQTEDEAWKEYKSLEEELVIQEIHKRVPKAIKQASKWAEDHYQVMDAFDGMKKCKPGIAHFAEVDPPYGVDLNKVKSRNREEAAGEYEEIDADEYVQFYKNTAEEVYRILRKDAFAVFWFGPTWHSETRDVLRKVGFTVPDIPAVWTKGPVGQTASPDTTFGSCYEPFWLARKGRPKLAKPGRGNVFDYHPIAPSKKVHRTEKPLDLLVEILNTILLPGSGIIVPFLGSGVTLRAAYRTGHTGWGYDLSAENKENFMRRVRDDLKKEGEEK